MKGVVESSFRLNLTTMKLIGLYPSKKYLRFSRCYSYVIYTIALLPGSFLGVAKLFLGEEANYSYDLVSIGLISIGPKLLSVVINSENIQNCILYFDNEIFARQSKHHMDVINACVRICRTTSNVFFFGCVAAILGWCGKLFFDDHSQLPLNVWLPVDMQRFYNCLYFDFVFGVIYVTLGCGAIDPLIAGLLCHATGQLQVLKKNLKHLEKDCKQIEINAVWKSRMIYERITQCIEHYDVITNFVDKYERCFSSALFFQFMESILIICVCCLQISKLQSFNLDLLILANYMFVLLLQVYFYCYHGTTLIEENNTLVDAVYTSYWYEYNQPSKRALIILMERSKRPLVITAGKILDVSLDTFTLILRRSYSLLAVLKNY